MTPISATLSQARRLAAGSTLIVVPIPQEQQPPPTYEYNARPDDHPDGPDIHIGMLVGVTTWGGKPCWEFGAHWGGQPVPSIPFPECPYARVGEPLAIAEPWAICNDHVYLLVDRRDGFDCPWLSKEGKKGIGNVGLLGDECWQSASEMPLWAIRHKPLCTSIGVKRLGELTIEEAQRIGFDGHKEYKGHGDFDEYDPMDDFKDDWTADHGSRQSLAFVWLIGHERVRT